MTHKRKRSKLKITVVTVVLLLVILGVGWFVVSTINENAAVSSAISSGKETILNRDELKSLASKYPPLYWAGPRDDTQYAVTVIHNRIFVRYIAKDDSANSGKQYLTVVTYYATPGYDALSKASDADIENAKSGAVITTFKNNPNSTYFAFPKEDFQVEVFSPVAGQARSLVEDGTLKTVN